MKKILFVLFLICGTVTATMAQTDKPVSKMQSHKMKSQHGNMHHGKKHHGKKHHKKMDSKKSDQ